MKRILALFVLCCSFACAENVNLMILNYNSQSTPILSFRPPDAPPMILVWVFDSGSNADGYIITVSYTTADGATHSTVNTLVNSGMGYGVTSVLADAITVKATAQPYKSSGASATAQVP